MNTQPDRQYIRVLTIAGSDSGGGAGIQADLKTFAALGCYGMSALTALTAQNTCGVTAIHAAPTAILTAQIDAVVSDIGAHATKVGMLHSVETVQAVAAAIRQHALAHVVLDPVMVSNAGSPLIEPSAVAALVRELFPLAEVITPNLDEAAMLLGRPVADAPADVPAMHAAGQALLALGAKAVLLKGGHLGANEAVHDLLFTASGQPPLLISHPRVATRNLHGAGCTLSSAIAAFLAQGQPLAEAVQAGCNFVHQAIAAGAAVRTGHGSGPLNHGAAPLPMRTLAL